MTFIWLSVPLSADYEMQLAEGDLFAMLQRRGFDPTLSFGAFDTGGRITAFTLNGTGDYNGHPTAYDTGTGTLPAYRGKGVATAIFRHSLPYLKEAGVTRYLLEVLRHNTGAVSVYRNLGFRTTREFDYFSGETARVIKTDIPKGYGIVPLRPAQIPLLSHFMDFLPSWQNSMESIERAPDRFIAFAVETDSGTAGYCVFEPLSGDVTQIAVDPRHRRKGVASGLLTHALEHNRTSRVKVVNTETACGSIAGFLSSVNIPLRGRQFEMMLDL